MPTTTPRRTGPALAIASALVVSGCAGIGSPGGEPLLGARLLPEDPAAIEVEFSGCDSSPEAQIVESDGTVRITIDGPNDGCEPVHEMTVELGEPLGDRVLIDGATGDEVPVAGR